mgnify:CR=1 FL=1
MPESESSLETDWRKRLPGSLRPYLESAPLAAFFLGVSSGFPYALIGATLTTRLAQDGITKSAVTAFALTFLAYNFKFLWAPIRSLWPAAFVAVAHQFNGHSGGYFFRGGRS